LELIKHEHKKQLHARILERCTLLYVTLSGLEANPDTATSERAGAVEEALAALQSHLTGGWDSIDESEAVALARWLRTSRFLVDDANPEPYATPALDQTVQS
jgi:hypothetical protein